MITLSFVVITLTFHLSISFCWHDTRAIQQWLNDATDGRKHAHDAANGLAWGANVSSCCTWADDVHILSTPPTEDGPANPHLQHSADDFVQGAV